MRPTIRVATTGVPPRSRRKAAHGTRAMAILELWANMEGANREFLTDLEWASPLFAGKLLLGLGLGLGSEKKDEPILGEEKDGALVEVEM